LLKLLKIAQVLPGFTGFQVPPETLAVQNLARLGNSETLY